MTRHRCSSQLNNRSSRVPGDALHLVAAQCHVDLVAGAAGMAALVLLAGCLPGHAKLRGDLRPPEALADGRFDELRQFCLGLVSLDPNLPDCSSSSATDSWVTRFEAPGWLAGAGSRRSGCAFLALGTGLRLDLLTSPACGSGATILS